jgi:hypothetical protein
MPAVFAPVLTIPFVPGEEYEVYFVFITLLVSFIILYLIGQYWQK